MGSFMYTHETLWRSENGLCPGPSHNDHLPADDMIPYPK